MKFRFATIVGNILEHYDTALFALLAPFIAPLFFSSVDSLTALIMTYGLIPLGMITKPLGSLFFGRIGDLYGRKKALSISLLGIAMVTFLIGCLPTYKMIGSWAPLSLMVAKMMQKFFSAGETSGGALYFLEGSSNKPFLSSLYGSASMLGVLLASFLVSLMAGFHFMAMGWRLLFWLGGLTAFVGFFFRNQIENSPPENKSFSFKRLFAEDRTAFLSIIIASGFSYVTFALSFSFMNGFIPHITSLALSKMIEINTFLLICDMLLLPIFGLLAHRIGKEKVMFFGLLGAMLTTIPLFSLLKEASFLMVVCVRMSLVFFGCAFAAPFYAWAIEQTSSHRYTILSLGSSLGAQLIGAPTAMICLWLYQGLGITAAPGFYLVIIAALTLFIMKKRKFLLKINKNIQF